MPSRCFQTLDRTPDISLCTIDTRYYSNVIELIRHAIELTQIIQFAVKVHNRTPGISSCQIDISYCSNAVELIRHA